MFDDLTMKVWNRHPNSKFEICYWNSKYIYRIPNMYLDISNFEYGWRFQAFVFNPDERMLFLGLS